MDQPLRIIVKVQPLTLDAAPKQEVAPCPRPSTLNAIRAFAREFRPQ